MQARAEAAAACWFAAPALSPLGAGHIHDTYLVDAGDARYVLQRVNETVFTDAQLVMAQTAVSSQMIDNLNASIHLRALLTDLFLIDEILDTHATEGARGGES